MGGGRRPGAWGAVVSPLVLSCLAALPVAGGVRYGLLERPVAPAGRARRRSAPALDADPLTGPAS